MVAVTWLANGLPPVASHASAAPLIRPAARLQTEPVPNSGDAADDPAIWIHPSSPELSLILGTDKRGGLHSYNMDGSSRQAAGDGTEPNNVDVLYGFTLGTQQVDLAVATTRAPSSRGLKIWRIDPGNRRLTDVTDGNAIAVLRGGEPYGCGTYTNPRTGASFVFVTAKDGTVEQYLLESNPGGRVGARMIRRLSLDSQVEGCVADDELGFVYFGEEKRGVWKFEADPTNHAPPELIAQVGDNGLHADVEGLAIWHGTEGRGYLLVSSQGNNTFKVYERSRPHRFVATIDPGAGRFGDVRDTDGIAVTSCPTSSTFPHGLFIAQDGDNAPANQNFKVFAWEDIAGTTLLVDTNWSPRARQ